VFVGLLEDLLVFNEGNVAAVLSLSGNSSLSEGSGLAYFDWMEWQLPARCLLKKHHCNNNKDKVRLKSRTRSEFSSTKQFNGMVYPLQALQFECEWLV
jgi:hypothetical protein